MTAGQLLHIDTTLAQLPGFAYGVIMDNHPHIYGYGNAAGTWELFERTDRTDPAAQWLACWNKAPGRLVLDSAALKAYTASRPIPLTGEWTSRDESVAWLVSSTLTEDPYRGLTRSET